jgi:CubicO group peptidase (beta-lactamase class C family)
VLCARTGLSSLRLEEAAEAVGRIRERYCFLVFKGGALIHETYYHNTSETLYETDSLAKTMIAQLVGVAVTRGYLDLDVPVVRYGVNTSIAGRWSDVLNTRHLLAQSSGLGRVPPGDYFTYDSDAFIQLLSTILGKVVPGGNVLEWATEVFAVPLGIPDVFANDTYIGGGNISAGGGQQMSCRQVGRIGQLLLNHGSWRGKPGEPAIQLYSEAYAEAMATPQFPVWGTSYGLLTWLNLAGASPAFCCAPRWCQSQQRSPFLGFDTHQLHGIVGCDIEYSASNSGPLESQPRGPLVKAPPSALISYGFQARVMYVDPESELVVVTMGQTEGNSLWDGGCSYDEGFTITLMVQAWQNATTPDPALKQAYDAAAAGRVAGSAADSAAGSAADSAAGSAAGRVGEWAHERHGERSSTAAARTIAARPPSSRPAQLGKQAPPTGSCFCFCPPGEGFGTCANVYDNSTHCDPSKLPVSLPHPIEVCPATGLVQQCGGFFHSKSPNPSCFQWVDQSYFDCDVIEPCPQGHLHPLDRQVCSCRPKPQSLFQQCIYQPLSCEETGSANGHRKRVASFARV